MTFEEIKTCFEGVAQANNLGFGYAPFREGKEPQTPYLAFSYPDRHDFPGDNKAYVRISRVSILLVTSAKEIDLEEAVEAELVSLGIQFSKESDFYRDEDVFISTYETEELIDAE